MVDHIIEHCDGMIGIADDVVIHGKDDEEHYRHLHQLIKKSCEHSFVFNCGKCAVKQPSMTFFGCIYDKDGAHLDPAKVSVVHRMPPPETPKQLQKFFRMALCHDFHPSMHLSMNCLKRAQSSHGMNHTRKLLIL